jgi:anti-sigma B factor antagonist
VPIRRSGDVGSVVSPGGEHRAASDDRLREIHHLATGSTSLVAEHVEGRLLVDVVPLHEDPFRPLGHRPTGERPLKIVVLGEASKHDVDGTLHLLWIMAIGDVGEDASLGGLVDERPILHVEDGDHRARGLVNDPVDQLQGLRSPFVHDHDGDIGALVSRDPGDLGQRGLPRNNVVSQRGHGTGHLVKADPWPVGDEDAEVDDLSGHLFWQSPKSADSSNPPCAREGRRATLVEPTPAPGSRRLQARTPGPRPNRRSHAPQARGVRMGSKPAFTAQIESRNGVTRVALSGEFDALTAPLLKDFLAPLEADGAATILLDLRDLTFIDSAGLHELLRANQRADTNGRRFLVVGARPTARRLFEITDTQFLIEEPPLDVLHKFARNSGERSPETGSDRGPDG